jgi:hypothetical protein
VAAWLALAAWDLVTPEFRQKAREAAAADELHVPELDTLLDPSSKDAVKSIVAARAERDRLAAESPEHLRSYVQLALASVPELERHAVLLVERLESHTRYISHGQRRLTDPAMLRDEIHRLEQQIATTGDDEARKQLALARDARQAQVGELEALQASRERVQANLTRVVATLESLPSRMLKMRTLDDASMDSVTGDFGGEIDRINDELRAFEDTLRPMEARVR